MNMDRFKFRIWCEADKDMTYPDSPDIDGELPARVFLAEYLQAVWENEPDENMILMACTGLKDSEGKLVYEGDVVEVDDRAIGAPNISIGQVYYCLDYTLESNPCFAAYGNNGHFRLSPSIKVLGNRYQHPELLEGER